MGEAGAVPESRAEGDPRLDNLVRKRRESEAYLVKELITLREAAAGREERGRSVGVCDDEEREPWLAREAL